MRKTVLLIVILSFGLIYSQKSKSKRPIQKDKSRDSLFHKIDSINLNEENKKDSNIAFYKNIDSTKASKYKILNKKPPEAHSQLQQKVAPFSVEKKNDTITVKKNK